MHGRHQRGDFVIHRHHRRAVGVNNNQVCLFAAFQTAVQVFVQQCAGAPFGGHPQNIL